jgi:hypothetical protein
MRSNAPHSFFVFALLVVSVGLLCAGAADAQRRGYGKSEKEAEIRSGLAMVTAVDVAGRTLVVDDETYRVDERTTIRRESGQAATLAGIRAPVPGTGQLLTTRDFDFIRFEAVERSGVWRMREITILEEPVQ